RSISGKTGKRGRPQGISVAYSPGRLRSGGKLPSVLPGTSGKTHPRRTPHLPGRRPRSEPGKGRHKDQRRLRRPGSLPELDPAGEKVDGERVKYKLSLPEDFSKCSFRYQKAA